MPQKALFMNVFRVIYQKRCFLKNAPSEYIDPSCHFVFYEICCIAHFIKPLPRTSLFVYWISVRFYETDCSSNFFCSTSPKVCSWGPPGGWIKICFYRSINTIGRFTEKNYDDCFINGVIEIICKTWVAPLTLKNPGLLPNNPPPPNLPHHKRKT